MTELAKKLIRKHEGLRLKPYRDTEGVLTIGYGLNLEDGITLEEAEFLLSIRVDRAAKDLQNIFPDCAGWNSRVYQAMLSMMYNLGRPRFMTFKKMIAAIHKGDWQSAAAEMLDSKWARQVPDRAGEISKMVSPIPGRVPEQA